MPELTFTTNNTRIKRQEAGNVLFLILIAVVLFAALSYAVSQSVSGGNTNMLDKELESIETAENNYCMTAVKNGISQLKILNRCDESEISYELPKGGNANPNAPADKSCHLFDPDGAGLSPCGAYLVDNSVETGIITLGDTDTVALMPSGAYLRCASWVGAGSRSCNLQLSTNGTDFSSATQSGCLYKSDGSGGRDFMTALSTFQPLYANALCSAACGGAAVGSGAYAGSTGVSYVEDDYTLTTYTGSCGFSMLNVNCDCWD